MNKPDVIPELFHDELQRCIDSTTNIGQIVETVVAESKAMRTIMSRHETGFSIQRFRRHFQHVNGVEIPNSSYWVLARIEQWSSNGKLFDIIDSQYDVAAPTERIEGDIDD